MTRAAHTHPAEAKPYAHVDLGREVIHVADKTGRYCGDCGALICAPAARAFYPYEHVVVMGGDSCAAWRTTREITCERPSYSR